MLSRLLYTDKYSKTTDTVDLEDHYAKNTISQMINSGIYTNIPKDYDVSENITRGEMVHIVNNIIYLRDNSKCGVIEDFIEQNYLFKDLLVDKYDVYYDDCLK